MTLRQAIRHEQRRSLRDRWCFVCGTPVPDGAGVARMHLSILTHQGACSAWVENEERIYDHSDRGRWRPRREVLARLHAARSPLRRLDDASGMICRLHALILRRGNVVRSEIAWPSTVARYLAQVSPLADYQVAYWYQEKPYQVTAEGFLALYEAGRLLDHPTLTEGV